MDSSGPLKLKLRKVSFWALLMLILNIIGSADGSGKRNDVTETEISPDVTPTMAIIIGPGNQVKRERRAISVNEDEDGGSDNNEGDDGTGSGGGSGRLVTVSTTVDKCSGGKDSKCCFQYTWLGPRGKVLEGENATCEFLKKDANDESLPCFDPLVYTMKRSDSENLYGNPPDFIKLRDEAREKKHEIYCPMGTDNCVILTHYSRDGDKKIFNQTKFCGLVTNSNTGGRLTNGCYRQNTQGYIREVCVCTDDLCNGSFSISKFSPTSLLLSFAVFYFTLRNYNNFLLLTFSPPNVCFRNIILSNI